MRYTRQVLISTLIFFVSFLLLGCSQTQQKFYDASLDGAEQLKEAIEEANGRLILVQVGGDWCQWCVRLNQTISEDPELLKAINERFQWVHIYFGKENKNEAAMQMLDNPTDMGFPAFVLLDAQGKVLHKIPTGGFEEGDGYDKAKLLLFIKTLQVPENLEVEEYVGMEE